MVSASTDRHVLRLRSIAAAGLAAAAVALVSVASSSGDVPATLIVSGAGITEPAGVVRAPNGDVWVTDHLNGVCRVDLGTGLGSANGQGLVPSDYCGVTHQGPSETAGMTFDPATSNFYVTEASSDAGGIWRMHLATELEPSPGTITSAVKIADTPGDRVFGVALAATGPTGDLDPFNDFDVYFTTKRSTAVFRVTDPQTGGLHSTSVAGFANGEEVASLAAHGTTLFLAEPIGITQLDLMAAVPETAGALFGSPVSIPGGVPSAVAVDAANNRLYAGTANDNGVDQVDVIDLLTQDLSTYSSGFSGILGIHVEPTSGDVLVSDDPGLASGGVTEGSGRIFSIPFSSTNQAVTQITAAPANFTNQTAATFAFESATATMFECSLDGAAFASCTSPQTFDPVAEDTHTFEVRAAGTTLVSKRTWVVDLTAPMLSIDSTDPEIEGDSASLRFSASEAHVSFQCSLDGAAPEPCDSPFRADGLALGDHTFTVTGTDLAGNPAAGPATFNFRMVPRPVSSGPGSGGSGGSDSGGSSGPRADTPGDPQVTPVIVLRARAATLSRTRVRRRQLTSRPLGIAFDAHETARYARITIQPYHRGTAVLSRRSRRPRIVASLLRRVEGGQRNYIRWRLTRRQAQRLTAGRYRVTVALGATRRAFGPQRLLTLRVLGNG